MSVYFQRNCFFLPLWGPSTHLSYFKALKFFYKVQKGERSSDNFDKKVGQISQRMVADFCSCSQSQER